VTTTQNVFIERSFLVAANSFPEHIKDQNQQSLTRDIKKQTFSMPHGGTTSSLKLSQSPDYVLYDSVTALNVTSILHWKMRRA
jgi:hypothetical protein